MSPFEIIIAIIILGILVVIHELGHFLVAKIIGVRVEEFGIGLPPRWFGIKRGETIYSVNKLPFGGFVRLAGEDEDESSVARLATRAKRVSHQKSDKEQKRYFWARSKKERAAILLAGVGMNFLLAVVIISFIFTQGVFVPTERVHIEKVVENSPATDAGIKEQDIVITFADKVVKTPDDLITTTKERSGLPTSIVVDRNGQRLSLTITPRKDPPKDQGPMGIVISNLEEKRYAWYQAPFYGTIEAFKISFVMYATIFTALWRLVTFQPVGMDVAGPIRIVEETAKAVKGGFLPTLNITWLISLNLALINLLPIPALDGGRLLFVVLEKFGRKVKPQVERVAHQIFLALLLALIALISVNDILSKIPE